jgi:hypothetical protein
MSIPISKHAEQHPKCTWAAARCAWTPLAMSWTSISFPGEILPKMEIKK